MIWIWQYDTAIKLRACKRTGHIVTFQRYFDTLSQKALLLSFITSIEVDTWILSAAWLASKMHRRNVGNQADMLKLSSCDFLNGGWITNAILMTQHQNCTQSNNLCNNLWLDIPVRYTTSQKIWHNVGLQPIYFTEKQQTVCW